MTDHRCGRCVINAAHMQIALGKWNFDIQIPEPAINLQQQLTLHPSSVAVVRQPDTKIEIKWSEERAELLADEWIH